VKIRYLGLGTSLAPGSSLRTGLGLPHETVQARTGNRESLAYQRCGACPARGRAWLFHHHERLPGGRTPFSRRTSSTTSSFMVSSPVLACALASFSASGVVGLLPRPALPASRKSSLREESFAAGTLSSLDSSSRLPALEEPQDRFLLLASAPPGLFPGISARATASLPMPGMVSPCRRLPFPYCIPPWTFIVLQMSVRGNRVQPEK